MKKRKKRKPSITPEEVRKAWQQMLIIIPELPDLPIFEFHSTPRTYRNPYLPDPRRDTQ